MATAADWSDIHEQDEMTEREGILEHGGKPYFSIPAVPVTGLIPEPASADELQLVQKLFFLGNDAPQVAVFCGVGPTDGSEVVCARAAEVLAGLVKEPVCLMDANLSAPTLHVRYDIGDAFRQPAVVSEIDEMQAQGGPLTNLWVLPASTLKDCSPGFSPDQVRDRVARLRKRFRFLLICAPALGTASEGFLLGQMADGVVLTLLAQSTHRAAALKVLTDLETYKIRLLGSVLNELRPEGAREKHRALDTYRARVKSKIAHWLNAKIRMG
jgi:Mrp family chromosome partitioning ATPase